MTETSVAEVLNAALLCSEQDRIAPVRWDCPMWVDAVSLTKLYEVGSLTQIMPAQREQAKANQLSPKLEQLIEQTRRQQADLLAEAAQKVAETAAWCLFGTAFTSAAASSRDYSASVFKLPAKI